MCCEKSFLESYSRFFAYPDALPMAAFPVLLEMQEVDVLERLERQPQKVAIP